MLLSTYVDINMGKGDICLSIAAQGAGRKAQGTGRKVKREGAFSRRSQGYSGEVGRRRAQGIR